MKQGSTLKLQAAWSTVNGALTFNWYLIARKLGEFSKMGKRKTAQAGAPIDDARQWTSIDWSHARQHVRKLQVRIAKAVLEGRWNKVKSLQNLLANSFYAKLLAVRRVTSNKGKSTPGVDGILWKGARAKWRAVFSLRRRGYQPQWNRGEHHPREDLRCSGGGPPFHRNRARAHRAGRCGPRCDDVRDPSHRR